MVVVGGRGDTPVPTHPPVTPATTTHPPTRPAEFQAPDKKAPRYDKCLETMERLQWGIDSEGDAC